MRPSLQSVIIFSLFLIFGIRIPLSAQSLLRSTEFLTGRDMVESRVQCALQDREGLLWFGTNVGLCRYDGVSFRYFMSTPENNYPLSSNYVSEICEQQSLPGYLWVVTLNQQVYRFCIATSEFVPILPLLKSDWIRPLSRRSHQVLYPMEKNQVMWVVLNDGSCARFSYQHPANNTVWPVEEQGRTRVIYNIYEDHYGREWLLTDRGPRIYGKAPLGDYPFSMIKERGDTIFLGSKNGYQACYTEERGFRFIDEPDSLLFCTDSQAGTSWPPADAVYYEGDHVPDQPLRDILVDRQGNHWMSSETALYRLSSQPLHTQFYELPFDDAVNAILPIDDRHLLFGTSYKHIVGRMSLDDGQCQYLTSSGQWCNEPVSFAKGGIQCLYKTQDETLWIGTWRDGLYHVENNRVEHYLPGDSLGLNNPSVKTIYEDEYNHLWVGTSGGGINVLSLNSLYRGFYHRGNRYLRHPGSDYNNIQSISGDHHGHIMVGTTRGLLTFASDVKRLAEIRYYIHTRLPDNSHSLPVNPVSETFFDKNGQPYVCTYGFNTSLLRKSSMLSDTAYFETYYNHDYPEANTVLTGTVDKNGNVWTVNEFGIQMLHHQTGCLDVYRRNDFGRDLRLTDCTMQSTPNGWMYVGAGGGILAFHCDSLHKSGFRPQIVFSDLCIEGSQRLYVHLASLDYRPAIAATRFAYWLEGFDEQWNYSVQPDLTFTNLKPGRYTLHVKSTNSEGSWTDNEATLSIVIPMTWNNSWYWTYVLLVFLLMGVVVWYVARRFRAALAVERQLVDRLRGQLEEKRQELQRTSVALDVAKANMAVPESKEVENPVLAAIQESKTWGLSNAEMEQMEVGDRLFLERIQQYVLEHMQDPDMEVGDLADVSHVSRTGFYRRLKQLSGLSPVDFIRQQRLEYAKSIIVEGRDTISEVAYKVGFSDPKYFSKCFKKYVGLTPQEYKQMVQSEKGNIMA